MIGNASFIQVAYLISRITLRVNISLGSFEFDHVRRIDDVLTYIHTYMYLLRLDYKLIHTYVSLTSVVVVVYVVA